MYTRIMIPVDLEHADQLERALKTGADLAKHYGSSVTYVGVTGVQPSRVAHSPEEFAQKLEAFVRGQAEAHGLQAEAKAVVAHDPATEMDKLLADTVDEIGADLVVMGSHIPRTLDFGSHGGALATHTAASVMLVRDT